MEINPANVSSLETYNILIAAVSPRPIAWVSTLDASGNVNLAPFSFFTVASVNPPVLCFAPLLLENSSEKDTLQNIKQTGEFVVNVVSCNLAQKMNQTSAPYPPGVNEFVAAEVASKPSTVLNPPRVADAPISFECKLHQIVSLGSEPRAGNLVLGKVCNIHVHPEVFRNGQIDSASLDTIGRLWDNWYATTRDRFEIKRPER